MAHSAVNMLNIVALSNCKTYMVVTQTILNKRRTAVNELTNTVVTKTTMGGPGWPEDLAGKAVLEFNYLAFNNHLLGTWWRPVISRRSCLRYFCNTNTLTEIFSNFNFD